MAKRKDNEESFVANTAPSTPATDTPEPQIVLPAQLGLAIVGLIDKQAKQGGFEGPELLSVGVIRQQIWERIVPYITPQAA